MSSRGRRSSWNVAPTQVEGAGLAEGAGLRDQTDQRVTRTARVMVSRLSSIKWAVLCRFGQLVKRCLDLFGVSQDRGFLLLLRGFERYDNVPVAVVVGSSWNSMKFSCFSLFFHVVISFSCVS